MRRLAVLTFFLITGCGGGAVSSDSNSLGQTASPLSPHVTLTDSDCKSDSAGEVRTGTTSFTVGNEASTGPANFELVRLAGTFEEADQFLTDVRAGLESPPGELPFITEEADRAFVDPGGTGELSGDLIVGAYAIVCVRLDENEDIINAYVVGPYTVSQ